MTEQLVDEAGRPVDTEDIDRDFAAAMAAPPADAPVAEPPPRRPPEPPADPVNAPNGWTWDHGEWRPKKVVGRPRGEMVRAEKTRPAGKDTARAAGKPGGGKDAAAPAEARDYTEGLAEFSEGLWMVMAGFTLPLEPWGTKLKAQAAVLKANREQLCVAFNDAAHKNAAIRRGVEKVTGPQSWAIAFVMGVAPFAVQSAALWRAPMDGDDGAAIREAAAGTDDAWAEVTTAFRMHLEGGPDEDGPEDA